MSRLRIIVITFLVALATLVLPTAAQAVQTVAHDQIVNDNPANNTPHALDGEVDSIAQVGNLIVMGGNFTQVQNASGGATLNRRSIFAFDKDTGQVSTQFAPDLSGVVKTVVKGPGSTVYVGGTFNTANGANAYKIVQLNVPSGTVVSTFRPGRVNAIVQSVRYVGGRLFMGGQFTTVGGQERLRFAELNPTTGAVLSLDVPLEGTHWGGNTQIYNMDVNPDATKLVMAGNFTSVGGQSRTEVAMVDLTTNSLSSWSTARYEPRCYNVFEFIVRDVEFSPDGSYFVIGSTGGYGSGSPTLCDTVTRWESSASGAGQNPTWINYTGGDSVYSVAVTGSTIYTGGHMRWMNNPSRADALGAGGVERTGIAALDPSNGLPFSWAPGRARGQGVFDMLSTTDGLYIGSDTDRVRGEYHGKLAFFPLAGGGQIPNPQPPSLPVDLYSLGDTSSPVTNVLYRVNAGGPAVAPLDNGPTWQADSAGDSPYRNSGNNAATYGAIPSTDATVPGSTPSTIFDSERWDPNGGSEMAWSFPVAAGTDVSVRVYLANRCTCTSAPGTRQFDVVLDGNTVLDNYDPVSAGDQTGTMRSFDITSDGVVNLDFLHVVENPLVNGIEIIDRDAPPPPSSGGIVERDFDGSTVGAPSSVDAGGVDWSRVRGAFMAGNTLYTAWSDGRLLKRTFNGTTFGDPSEVNLNGLTQFASELQRMTGLFYEDGRIYYTLSGSSSLHMRYFTVESDIVGAGLRDLAPFTVAGSSAETPWASVRGMFLAGNRLYFTDRTTNELRSVAWSAKAPVAGTGTVVSGPSVDGTTWSQAALLARQGTPNALPTAGFGVSCVELTCSFTDSSGDPDGSIASRSWSFGDGGASTATNPTHTFPSAGSYQVGLTVVDNRGASDTETRSVTVSVTPNQAPTADFDVSCTELACSFTDDSSDSDGSIASRSWDFGDGATSTATNPDHTFGAAGSYDVVLGVTDDDGATDSQTVRVTVSEATADVSFVASATDDENASRLNHNVTVPAGTQAGDVLLLTFTDNAPNMAVTGPGGSWSQVGTESNTGMLTRYWTTTAGAGSAGSQVRVSTSASARAQLSVQVYRGALAPGAAQVTTAQETVTRAAHTTPGATIGVGGSWVVSVWSDKTASTTSWSAPAGQTARVNAAETGTGHTSLLVTDSNGPVPTGASPGLTATANSSSRQATMATIVLRPAV